MRLRTQQHRDEQRGAVLARWHSLRFAKPSYLEAGGAGREIRSALVNMEKMFGLLNVAAEIADKPDAPALVVSGGEIVFDHVDFHYEKARPILHDVSFRVTPREVVGLIGPNGAGKTTIVDALTGFTKPSAGRMLLNGSPMVGRSWGSRVTWASAARGAVVVVTRYSLQADVAPSSPLVGDVA